ncbi:bifunctional transcriptional activator/DNA repair enzyme AdaA [Paenibacillus sp. GCM10027626]|uniref:bifunctional transcriptional activator/DNA repair enzyme AdaA n=1 Tax=Paenibacillus sp. GCM10027626 TaxID=3273411 RepID=UPI003632CC83
MDAELFDTVYQSIVKKEATYDGIYYTGVKTTRIVCRPSCRAKTPKQENIILYPSVEAAIKEGFRPCKRCKPETAGTLNPDALLASHIDRMIAQNYGQQLTLAAIAGELAISPYHMQRVYKRMRGITPLEKLHQQRLAAARRLLENNTCTVLEIAGMVGFRSASHFASWFREQTGATPSAYRARNNKS